MFVQFDMHCAVFPSSQDHLRQELKLNTSSCEPFLSLYTTTVIATIATIATRATMPSMAQLETDLPEEAAVGDDAVEDDA